MKFLLRFGWYALIVAMLGDLLIPFILAPFYKGYSNQRFAISALGNPESPVRLVFNIWMLIEGILFLLGIPAFSNFYFNISKPLTIISSIFIAVFAVGACIFTCFFSVNKTKDVVTVASKIHGAGSVIGFMLFLFVPLIIALLSFKGKDSVTGTIAVISFILSLITFTLFVMSDKPEFKNTIIAKEGLWQRLNILFMYLPLVFLSIKNITLKIN